LKDSAAIHVYEHQKAKYRYPGPFLIKSMLDMTSKGEI